MLKEVYIYKTLFGREPFTKWLKSIKDPITKAHIQNRIRRLALGNYGKYRFLGNRLYELKIYLGPGYRIYCTEISAGITLILCAGNKSSQKRDIILAKKYLHDFRGRYGAKK